MTVSESKYGSVEQILAGFPCRVLTTAPSPIQRLRRLEEMIALGVEIYMKRDDLLRPLCGNKVRYIEYVLGAYDRAGADSLIHCGAQTSNYLAQLAIVGASEGVPVHLILLGDEPEAPLGNPLLEEIFGADIHYRPGRFGGSCSEHKKVLAAELRARGQRPYVIDYPFSNHSAILGYMSAYAELQQQIRGGEALAPDHVFLCSAGNSYLGLRIAADLSGDPLSITAFPPLHWGESGLRGIAPDRAAFLLKKVREFGDFVGCPIPTAAVDYDDRFVGGGYGVPTADSIEAVRLLARLEGVLLDPIYSGKAMSGLLALLRAGEFAAGTRVLFVHTGGMINVFTYHEEFARDR